MPPPPAASLRLTRSALASRRSFSPPVLHQQCLRQLATTAAPHAGHNKWSKTRNIKAVTDKKKMNERTAIAKQIELYARMYGDDVKANPQLAHALSAATKANVPRTVVDAALARGQGRPVPGANLKTMTMEILLPPNFALIADVETDNQNRTQSEVKLAVKNNGGVWGSTAFYFARRGRILAKPQQTPAATLDDMMRFTSMQEGVQDLDQLADGVFQVWTDPAALASVLQGLSTVFERLDTLECGIIWAPNPDTMAHVESPSIVESLEALLSAIRQCPEVKTIFSNVRQGGVAADQWDRVARLIDV